MKTLVYGALRAFVLLVVIVGLAACSSAPTKDYAAVAAAHAPQVVTSTIPTVPIADEDSNLRVTFRFVKLEESDSLLDETKRFYQLEVTATSKSPRPIMLLGTNASRGGKEVPLEGDLDALTDIGNYGTLASMGATITGSADKKIARSKALLATLVHGQVLQGLSSVVAYDYLPMDRVYSANDYGLWVSYKIDGKTLGFPISFTSPVSVATTTPAQ